MYLNEISFMVLLINTKIFKKLAIAPKKQTVDNMYKLINLVNIFESLVKELKLKHELFIIILFEIFKKLSKVF